MKPITKEAWDRVHKKALDIVNATLADDSTMSEIFTSEMLDLLDDLENEFGEHAIIYDMRGDYTDSYDKALDFYRRARQLAIEHDDSMMLKEINQSIATLIADNS